jgi:hypothetical protein
VVLCLLLSAAASCRANAQPVREHGSHGKHDGASRATNHGRDVAAQTPAPLPSPAPSPLPPGHLARAPAWLLSPPCAQSCAGSLPASRCSLGCHSPSQLAIITAILQSRWSAAVLVPPPKGPRQGQCHPGSLPAHIRRPLVSAISPSLRSVHDRRKGSTELKGSIALHDDARAHIKESEDSLQKSCQARSIRDHRRPAFSQRGRARWTSHDGEWRGGHPVGRAVVAGRKGWPVTNSGRRRRTLTESHDPLSLRLPVAGESGGRRGLGGRGSIEMPCWGCDDGGGGWCKAHLSTTPGLSSF